MRTATMPVQPANITQTLFVLRSANMTLTTDQALTRQFTGTNYVVTNVMTVTKSGAFGLACTGGVYTGAGKTGDAVVSAAQSWNGLTSTESTSVVPSSNIIQKQETATPFLSLTTGNTGTLTADLFIQGMVTD